MKKLPSLYTNSFDKKIDNSLDYIIVNTNNNSVTNDIYDINKKIDNIFKSSSYIYKIKVSITLEDKVIEEYIIGRNKNYIITMNNDIIYIKDILDIKELI